MTRWRENGPFAPRTEIHLAERYDQENCKVSFFVAGTLREPQLPCKCAMFLPRRLRHTECAYYLAVLLSDRTTLSDNVCKNC